MKMNNIGIGANWKLGQAKSIVKKSDNLASQIAGEKDLKPASDKVNLGASRGLHDIATSESQMKALKPQSREASPQLNLPTYPGGSFSTKTSAAESPSVVGAQAGAEFGTMAPKLNPSTLPGGSFSTKTSAAESPSVAGARAGAEFGAMAPKAAGKEASLEPSPFLFAGEGFGTKTSAAESPSVAGAKAGAEFGLQGPSATESVTLSEGKGGVLAYDFQDSKASGTLF